MKVILVKDIHRLGKEGKQVNVRDGYARNYLIPKGLAFNSTDENVKKIELIIKQRVKKVDRQKKQNEELKTKIEKLSLTVSAEVKEGEEIYGSITNLQIANLLKEHDIIVNKEKIILETSLKKLGIYHINIELCPEVIANLRVWVVKK